MTKDQRLIRRFQARARRSARKRERVEKKEEAQRKKSLLRQAARELSDEDGDHD